MKLSLIGMSGSGKSYWSKKLEEKGFLRFSCDEFIEKRLNTILKKAKLSGIGDVAKWMGQPYEPQYKTSSAEYLALEKEAMEYMFERLSHEPSKNMLLDTTGSVVYMEQTILDRLKLLTHIVYLQTPQSVQNEMYQLYLQDPKPVIWGDSFVIRKGETPQKALQQCYPKLLSYRTRYYETLADTTINYHAARQKSFGINEFLQSIDV